MEKAIFLDRDGTLNEDPGYLGNPDKLILYPDTGTSLAFLKNLHHFLLIVISNQSGIARGLITIDDVESVNKALNNQLMNYDVQIDAFYYCPHHPDFSSEIESICRKPSPKMIYDAAKDYNIDLSKSYFIGDSDSDIKAAVSAKVKTVLVKTGKGEESISILHNENILPSFVAENLSDACKFIINDSSGDEISANK